MELGLPWWLGGKESACNAGYSGSILGWEDPLEEEMATVLILLPEKFHGEGTLAVYSPWVRKEMDTTE